MQKEGEVPIGHTENIEDPYWKAAVDAHASGQGVARISTTVRNGTEFSQIMCTTTVSIECPQTKAYMDSAALLAFRAAVEYTNDGMSIIAPGWPLLMMP